MWYLSYKLFVVLIPILISLLLLLSGILYTDLGVRPGCAF